MHINFDNFNYVNSSLYCEDSLISGIAEAVGTPFYLYSKDCFTKQYRDFTNAFKELDHKVFYATKANSNINILKLMNSFGSGIEVNSGGELYRALKAGVNGDDISLTGIGKTEEEIRYGLSSGVHMLQTESLQEIELINRIAGEMGLTAPVSIRINPDVDPKTHPYIATGLDESKFGIEEKKAAEVFKYAASLPNIKVICLNMHIGSQLSEISPYTDAINKILKIKEEIESFGIVLKHLNIGGGFGIKYKDEEIPSINEFAELIVPLLKSAKCQIFFEPGRYFSGNSGALITKVLYIKEHKNKNFLVVDAGMTELIRPALYEAYHHIIPVVPKSGNKMLFDIVGPVCENGDFFALHREIEKPEQGDLLAIMSSGAYGFSMSSNYNSRRRVPEVLVDGDRFQVIRQRDAFEDLIKNEIMVL